MSKRPDRSDSHQDAKKRSSTELDPKMLNIAAGGHFYERAKSRRNRHREVLLSGSGRLVTDEAVPLGSKRKSNGGMKEALARLRKETDIHGNADRKMIQRKPASSATEKTSKKDRASDTKNKQPTAKDGTRNTTVGKHINLKSDKAESTSLSASVRVTNNRKTEVIDLTE